MVIQHNIAALNSHRNLGINNSATSKNLEKLSSGYRINRAGDDAAGLAISEKMRGQIRGLAMAEQNTENGISLIQTAEGGLNETHAILQRMRELSVQASNGTYQDDDRKQIAIEVQALKDEIDRIASSTHYNGIKLLNGTTGGDTLAKLEAGQTANSTKDYIAGGDAALGVFLEGLGFNIDVDDDGTDIFIKGELHLDVLFESMAGEQANLIRKDDVIYLQVGDKTYKMDSTEITGVTGGSKYTEDYSSTIKAGEKGYVFRDQDDNIVAVLHNLDSADKGDVFTVAGDDFVIAGIQLASGAERTTLISKSADAATTELAANHAMYDAIYGYEKTELIFQIGANGGADQRVSLHVDNMSTATLGLQGAGEDKLWDISINTREEANDAIKVIDAATNQVSAQRASLGALQNRLEHTLNNLGVTKENLTAAESTIRDVDMAKEMMEFTKNNILVQASQAMLAQANALPQGVLSLLR